MSVKRLQQIKAGGRTFWRSASRPQPIPAGGRVEGFGYGAAQPVLAVRLLLLDGRMLRAALTPVAWLSLFCLAVALAAQSWFGFSFLKTFYATLAALAPVPSVLFAEHYRRFAVLARGRLGFGPCSVRHESLGRSLRHAWAQFYLLTFGAPGLIPAWPGALLLIAAILLTRVRIPLLTVLFLGWSIHWIVVEAFDSARVLQPGETHADAERQAALAPRPWFMRALRHGEGRVPGLRPGFTDKRMPRRMEQMAEDWREEMAMVEAQPWLALGFGAATAILLAIPVLNLFLRPVIVLAAAHILGHLESPARSAPSPLPQAVASVYV